MTKNILRFSHVVQIWHTICVAHQTDSKGMVLFLSNCSPAAGLTVSAAV